MNSSAPKRPQDVTEQNWESIKEQGFEWLTNLNWPLDDELPERREETPKEFVRRQIVEFGSTSVMLGHGYDLKRRVPSIYLDTVGVYIRPPAGYYQT